jgi:hypothetical protein
MSRQQTKIIALRMRSPTKVEDTFVREELAAPTIVEC